MAVVEGVCGGCGHPADDHTSAGSCFPCCLSGGPCAQPRDEEESGPGGTARLWCRYKGGAVILEMPAATTARYAAMRLAEKLGMDPDDRDYGIWDLAGGNRLDEGEVMAYWDGRWVGLCWPFGGLP